MTLASIGRSWCKSETRPHNLRNVSCPSGATSRQSTGNVNADTVLTRPFHIRSSARELTVAAKKLNLI